MDQDFALKQICTVAALSSAGWIGKMDAYPAWQATAGGMRSVSNSLFFSGSIVSANADTNQASRPYRVATVDCGQAAELGGVVDSRWATTRSPVLPQATHTREPVTIEYCFEYEPQF